MVNVTEAELATILRRRSKPEKRAKAFVPLEAQEQEAVITWARCNVARLPDVDLLFHIPNEGAHHKVRQGVQAGVPDLFLPVPRGGCHGLWIEMKKADHSNGPSPLQKAWLGRLEEQGYRCAVAYGSGEAIDAIESYLAMS